MSDAGDAEDLVWHPTPEVARFLRVTPMTVRRMIHAGEIRAHRRGRQWRVPSTEIDRLRRPPD